MKELAILGLVFWLWIPSCIVIFVETCTKAVDHAGAAVPHLVGWRDDQLKI
jgi:hypothetical protein